MQDTFNASKDSSLEIVVRDVYDIDGDIANHSWDTGGVYEIKVQVKDDNESGESDWSAPLPLNIQHKVVEPEDIDPSEPSQTIENTLNERKWTITADHNLEGTVRIDLYNDNYPSSSGNEVRGKIPFGRIWIFDLGHIEHTFYSTTGNYNTILENGGVMSVNSNSGYMKEFPSIYDTKDTILFKIMQIRGAETTSGGGAGLYRIRFKVLNNFIREPQTFNVYNLKTQIYGDYRNVWYDYFTSSGSPEFIMQSGSYSDTLRYNKKSTELIFSSCLIQVSLDNIK